MQMRRLNPFEVQPYWTEAEPLLTAMLDKTGLRELMDEHHIWAMILQDLMQLWAITDEADELHGIIVTELKIFPKARQCNILYGSGEVGANQHGELLDQIVAWAKAEQACTRVQMTGRLGWMPLFKSKGFQHPMTTMTKVLTDEKFLQ